MIKYKENESIKTKAKLHRYFEREKPICPSWNDKKFEHVLVLPHVGDRYCVSINGKSRKILFVGIEPRSDDKDKSVYERTEQILNEGCNSRFYKKPVGQWKRNPHMRGITLALALLLEKDFSNHHKHEDEIIDNRHMFDYFALSNWHLCGHFIGKTSQNKNQSMNKVACKHFFEITQILKPDIVILTGSIYFVDMFNKVFKNKYHWINKKNELVFECEQFEFPIICFSHPHQKRWQKLRWDNPNCEYYKLVKETIDFAIKNII